LYVFDFCSSVLTPYSFCSQESSTSLAALRNLSLLFQLTILARNRTVAFSARLRRGRRGQRRSRYGDLHHSHEGCARHPPTKVLYTPGVTTPQNTVDRSQRARWACTCRSIPDPQLDISAGHARMGEDLLRRSFDQSSCTLVSPSLLHCFLRPS